MSVTLSWHYARPDFKYKNYKTEVSVMALLYQWGHPIDKTLGEGQGASSI